MLRLESCPVAAGQGHEAGRALLKRMYEAYTGEPMPQILKAERGKPYFLGKKLHFSITHTKRRVFCALSDRPIGVDAEELDRDISLKLAQKILSAPEYARYEKLIDKKEGLLRFWVLKEAQAKCTGQGIIGYPNKTDFSPDDPRVMMQDGCLLAVVEEEEDAV